MAVMRSVLLLNRAAARLATGDRERALAIIEAATPSVLLVWLLRYPDFEALRSDTRFQRAMATARAAP
jgi:hypothetical protein